MQELRNRLVRMLREAADNIAAGTCEMSEAEAMDIINSIVHEAEHIKQAMLHTYKVEDKGEPPAYTVGYLVQNLLY